MRYAYKWLYDKQMPPPSSRSGLPTPRARASGQRHSIPTPCPSRRQATSRRSQALIAPPGRSATSRWDGPVTSSQTDGPVALPRVPAETLRLVWPACGDRVEFPPPATLTGDDEMGALATPAEWRRPSSALPGCVKAGPPAVSVLMSSGSADQGTSPLDHSDVSGGDARDRRSGRPAPRGGRSIGEMAPVGRIRWRQASTAVTLRAPERGRT
jgi:hypothetical protein